MESKTARLTAILALFMLSSCGARKTEVPPATHSPTSAATSTPALLPTATPRPTPRPTPALPGERLTLEADLLEPAREMCDKEVETGVSYFWTWAAKGPTMVLFDRDYDDQNWSGVELMGASAREEIRSITCIKETRIDKGFYLGTAGGGRGYQRNWDLWLVSWPEGAPMGSQSFSGTSPPQTVTTGGDHYGAIPKGDALEWLTAALAEPWANPPNTPNELRLSEDGARLVVDLIFSVGTFDAETGELLGEVNYTEDGPFVPFVTLSPEGDLFAATVCGEMEGDECVYDAIEVRDAQDGSLLQRLSWDPHYPLIYNHAFTPDGRFLYAGHSGNIEATTYYYVRRWGLQTGAGMDVISEEIGRDSDLFVTPDGEELIVLEGSAFRILDRASGEARGRFRLTYYGADHPLAFSSDSSFMAAVHCPNQPYAPCESGEIKLFDGESYEEIATFGRNGAYYAAVALTSDGTLLAGGECEFSRKYTAEDGKPMRVCTSSVVTLWDGTTGEERFRLRGHTGEIRGLIFTPDGEYIYSASTDGTIRRWSLATGSE